jgi:hypothetical protein
MMHGNIHAAVINRRAKSYPIDQAEAEPQKVQQRHRATDLLDVY